MIATFFKISIFSISETAKLSHPRFFIFLKKSSWSVKISFYSCMNHTWFYKVSPFFSKTSHFYLGSHIGSQLFFAFYVILRRIWPLYTLHIHTLLLVLCSPFFSSLFTSSHEVFWMLYVILHQCMFATPILLFFHTFFTLLILFIELYHLLMLNANIFIIPFFHSRPPAPSFY